jgi:hypothetical protein
MTNFPQNYNGTRKKKLARTKTTEENMTYLCADIQTGTHGEKKETAATTDHPDKRTKKCTSRNRQRRRKMVQRYI